jgi:hypothetical protein
MLNANLDFFMAYRSSQVTLLIFLSVRNVQLDFGSDFIPYSYKLTVTVITLYNFCASLSNICIFSHCLLAHRKTGDI